MGDTPSPTNSPAPTSSPAQTIFIADEFSNADGLSSPTNSLTPTEMLSSLEKPSSDELAITQQEIVRLKKRRDLLLNTACNRHERGALFEEVKSINRRLQVLHERMT